MTDDTKKATGMAATNTPAAFVLDDRTTAAHLDAFRQYSQRLPYGKANENGCSETTNWAQVLLGLEAGASPDVADASWGQASERYWALERERLVTLYEAPERADGQLPPERTFLLALLGMLETPRALLNQLPAQHRALYYREMLALEARKAKADRVTVHFTLADGGREQVLPSGLLLDAGQDSAGKGLRYALTQPLTVNTARVTDLRWVVSDPCVPGGRRARVVLDEAAGQTWPEAGVRLFGASPARAGEAPRADADRTAESGRIIASSLLAVEGKERTWTITLATPVSGERSLCAAVSIQDTWVTLPCVQKDKERTIWTVSLSAEGGVPSAVTTLDGRASTVPLLRLTSPEGAPVPAVKQLEVAVTAASGVVCVRDDGTSVSEGGLPFGDTAEAGVGVNLALPAWWRLGGKLNQVTVTPIWSGLPAMSFPRWYGPDKTQERDDWLLLDETLDITTEEGKGSPPQELHLFGEETLAGRVTNGADIAKKISVDKGYPSLAKGSLNSNRYFTVTPLLMQQKLALQTLPPQALFDGSGEQVAPIGQHLSIALSAVPSASSAAPEPDVQDPAQWPWCVRLRLNSSFLHDEYAVHERAPAQTVTFLTEQTMTQQVPVLTEVDGKDSKDPKAHVYKMVSCPDPREPTKNIVMPAMKEERVSLVTPVPITVPKAQWNRPYVPQWSDVRIDYQAVDTQPDQRIIMPFGHALQDLTQAPSDTQTGAEVYLGIDGIAAGQQLTLHWQLKSPGALPLEWQYLATGERWVRLPVNDGTDGWQTSGLWSVDWPGDASRTAVSLPAGRMWLRGRVTPFIPRDTHLSALPTSPWLSGMVTNAAQARLVAPEHVHATHFEHGLPPGRITQALDMPETVQAVAQPWGSTGGRAAETQAAFDARVARRLRHRERGLNNIDLMALLQSRHDGIRELAVLPFSPDRNDSQRQTHNGTQQQIMVVMPGPALSDSDDARRPALSPQHLEAMVQGLKTVTSPWLALTCVNPEYIPLSVSWEVSYLPGLSRSAGHARVKAALEAAFMPWLQAADNGDARVIGRAVTHSMVRDVLHRVAGVATVHQVYLNGDKRPSTPTLTARQVVVLTCIPLEYTGLTLAWLHQEPDKPDRRFGELVLAGGCGATVQVTIPAKVAGVEATPIDTDKAEVYLVDLDTGRRVPETQGASLWATKATFPTSVKVEDKAAHYAQARDNARPDAGKALYFDVHTQAQACGIFRLGVVMVLTHQGVTLPSAAAGESITLYLHSPTS